MPMHACVLEMNSKSEVKCRNRDKWVKLQSLTGDDVGEFY
jgi:hypothetical protein